MKEWKLQFGWNNRELTESEVEGLNNQIMHALSNFGIHAVGYIGPVDTSKEVDGTFISEGDVSPRDIEIAWSKKRSGLYLTESQRKLVAKYPEPRFEE